MEKSIKRKSTNLERKASEDVLNIQDVFRSGFFYFIFGFVLLIFISNNYNQGLKVQKADTPKYISAGFNTPTNKIDKKTSKDKIVDHALSHLGIKYTYAGKKPSTGFDCSGFTSYVYKESGLKIPPSSITQSKFGEPVSLKDAERGDLIFFKSPTRGNERIGHVGIIVSSSNDKISFIHSSSSRGVVIDNLNSKHYKNRYRSVRRVL
ncbi:MAG TPA: C40 family peptidase [Cytophagales bacterium]|nr:C40 family peptidase [Cytophagales bacterium]